MSADRWTHCPRCVARHDKAVAERQAEVDALYGKVPVAEFDRSRAELEEFRNDTPKETFREDHEIGLWDAEFFIDYRGCCSECGFQHKFKHVADLTEEATS